MQFGIIVRGRVVREFETASRALQWLSERDLEGYEIAIAGRPASLTRLLHAAFGEVRR